MRILLRYLCLFIIGSCPALYAATVDGNFPIQATVLAQLQLTVLQNMSFGQHILVSGNTDVSPAQPAQIDVAGNANSSVAGSFGSSSISLSCQTSGSCGTDTILVDSFICSGETFNANCTGEIGSNSESIINIDAVMHLTAANRAGTYTGTQTFTLAYT